MRRDINIKDVCRYLHRHQLIANITLSHMRLPCLVGDKYKQQEAITFDQTKYEIIYYLLLVDPLVHGGISHIRARAHTQCTQCGQQGVFGPGAYYTAYYGVCTPFGCMFAYSEGAKSISRGHL